MAQVQVKERIYVDSKGRRVGGDFKGMKTLAASPGDEISEEHAAALGIKSSNPSADKSLKGGANKGGSGSSK